MKTILVTGANGFVGTHILKSLMKLNEITLIATCPDRTKLIPEFEGEVREGDFRDNTYLDSALDEVMLFTMRWPEYR